MALCAKTGLITTTPLLSTLKPRTMNPNIESKTFVRLRSVYNILSSLHQAVSSCFGILQKVSGHVLCTERLLGNNMVVVISRGTPRWPQNTKILIQRTPEKGPAVHGNSQPYICIYIYTYMYMHPCIQEVGMKKIYIYIYIYMHSCISLLPTFPCLLLTHVFHTSGPCRHYQGT